MANVSNLKKFFEEQVAADKPQKSKPLKPIKPSHLVVQPHSSVASPKTNDSTVKIKPTIPPKLHSPPTKSIPHSIGHLQNPFMEEGNPFVPNSNYLQTGNNQTEIEGNNSASNNQALNITAVRREGSQRGSQVGASQVESRVLKVPQQLVRKQSEEDIQRSHILKELLVSEQSFLTDMRLLKSIYIIPAKEAKFFSVIDLELLFGNVDGIIDVSSGVLTDLEIGVNSDLVGPVLKKHVS